MDSRQASALRRRLTGLREDRAHFDAEYEEYVGKLETLARRSGGAESGNALEMFKRIERKAHHAERRRDEVDAEIESLETRMAGDGGPSMTRDVAHPDRAARAGGDGFSRANRANSGRSAVLRPEERMADWKASQDRGGWLGAAEAAEVDMDRVLGAWIGGERGDLNEVETRVLAESVDAAGGFTVPEILGAGLIDRARKAAKVILAGATTVPVESDTHSIARLAGGVTGSWRAENAPITESDPTFERVTFKPKSHAVLTRLSRELAEDMIPSAFNGVTNELAQSIGLAVDFAALRGAGTGNIPQGIRFQPGVEILSLGANGAVPTNYDYLIDAVAGVQGDNFEPNAILYSARTAKTHAKMKDSTGQPLSRPPLVSDVQHIVTNQIDDNYTVGTSVDTSEVYCGLWSELLLGVRSNLRLEILRERFADNLQIGLIAHLRMDVQLAHPAAFTVVTGVRA